MSCRGAGATEGLFGGTGSVSVPAASLAAGFSWESTVLSLQAAEQTASGVGARAERVRGVSARGCSAHTSGCLCWLHVWVLVGSVWVPVGSVWVPVGSVWVPMGSLRCWLHVQG